jgi:hypothetical protein
MCIVREAAVVSSSKEQSRRRLVEIRLAMIIFWPFKPRHQVVKKS